MNPYIGSDFDDFLAEDGIQEDVTAAALKRVLAYQLEQAMKKHGVNQTEMARRMKTSRTTVRRLLNYPLQFSTSRNNMVLPSLLVSRLIWFHQSLPTAIPNC